jgi:hypothetical protein
MTDRIPTQAKIGLEWGTPPGSLGKVKIRNLNVAKNATLGWGTHDHIARSARGGFIARSARGGFIARSARNPGRGRPGLHELWRVNFGE